MPNSASPKTIGDVLFEMMQAWNSPLKEEGILSKPARFGYALAGSVPWVLFNLGDRITPLVAFLGGFGALTGVALQLGLGGLVRVAHQLSEPSVCPKSLFS